MASINYDTILSRFFTKVEAFDFLYNDMSDEMIAEFVSTWIHSAIAYPYIRKLFTTVSVDDEEKVVNYELAYSIDEFTDTEFVKEVLACAMIYLWLEPKVKSITNISQYFTSSEQKWYSQSQHLSELRALAEDSEYRIRMLIRDRGYLNNTYLDGGV